MHTTIYIENARDSGQMITVTEDFGDYSVNRDLKPGENARVAVSAFKSVMLKEIPLRRRDNAAKAKARRASFFATQLPKVLQHRYG